MLVIVETNTSLITQIRNIIHSIYYYYYLKRKKESKKDLRGGKEDPTLPTKEVIMINAISINLSFNDLIIKS